MVTVTAVIYIEPPTMKRPITHYTVSSHTLCDERNKAVLSPPLKSKKYCWEIAVFVGGTF